MTEINPPGFLQNAGSTHTAEIMREIGNVFLQGRGVFSQRARGGINPAIGAAFVVQQNGTPNMSVNVVSGHALVEGTESAAQGVYSCFNDGTVNKSIAASDPSLPRIDTVVLRVRDSFYSGATNAWAIEIVTGVAASSPAVPSTPANSMVIAKVAVAAGATSIVTANITDVRPFMAATGGLIPIRTQADRDALLNLYDGYPVYRMDNNQIEIYNGSTWDAFARTVDIYPMRIAKGSDQTVTSSTTLVDDSALQTGTLPANSFWKVECQIYYIAGGGPATNGMKMAWSGPAGATFDWCANSGGDNAGNSLTTIWKPRWAISDTLGVNGSGGTQMTASPEGELAIGGTPGAFKYRWAQQTSSGVSTIVKAGSRMYLTRVG